MRISVLALALALALVANGCIMANLTPQARFSESAHTLTEAGRWNHLDMALPLLSTKYTEQYVSRHRHWGGEITIADADILRMQVADDRQSAMSEVSVTWYHSNGVTIRQSTISQQWEAERGIFKLVGEKVRAGDASLFAVADEPAQPAQPAQPAGS
jgi:hypothetical protein